MRILLAVHHFPPRYTGGAEWRAYRTAAALQARGHTVRVLCVERINSGPASGVAWEDGVFQGIAVRRLSFNLAAAPDPFRWEYDNVWIGDHLRELCQDWQPELLHLISGYLLSGRILCVAKALSLPVVLTLTDFWFLCRRINLLRSNGHISALPTSAVQCAQCQGEERRRYRWLGRWFPALARQFWKTQTATVNAFEARRQYLQEALRCTDVIISPSEFLRTIYLEAGAPPERLVFARQGYDFSGLSADALDKPPAAVLRVGYLGQIAPHKGVHVLFEALRHLPGAPIQVWAYGDASAFPAYAKRLQELAARDARLQLAGVYDRQHLSRVLRELDVVVIPSLWYENSPNSILEAFAHRTPVIASRLGGMAELVKDGENGLLFEPGNAAALGVQLRRLLAELDLWPRLQQGIGPVLSVTEEMDTLEAFYQRALTHNAQATR